MRVYLSGAISSNANYERDFSKAQKKLESQGYEVVNPCFLKTYLPFLKWEDYMKIDLGLIDTCDSLYLIQGWTKSKGSRFELEYAKLHGKTIMYGGKRKPKKERPLTESTDVQ